MADDDVTQDQLRRARADIQRQIEVLQTPSRSIDRVLNEGMIARLRAMLTEIDEQLAHWNDRR